MITKKSPCCDSKEQIPNCLYKLMILFFIGIFAFITFTGNFNSPSVFVYSLFLSFVTVKLLKRYNFVFDGFSDLKLLIVLSAVCFVFKFLWIYFMRMVPQVDYETFYNAAVSLSESWSYHDRYVALFPHILGYSTFLSLFFKLFGESVFLATLINVILSVISGILIYKIVKEFISTTAAVCSYLLWIVCPSQTVYNSLVLSDPLYTTFILAFVYLVVVIARKEKSLNWKKMLLYGALAGLILQCINVNRPIAMVLIIAMLIWIFVLRFKDLFAKEFVIKWLLFFAVLLIVYFLLGALWNACLTSRLGEAPASVPGYNVHVGFNVNSNGSWNSGDSGLLTSYSNQEGATADWAQRQMLEEAKERISSLGLTGIVKLFMNKLRVFLGEDSVCIWYCNSIITDQQPMRNVCDVFYYFLVVLSLFGAYKMLGKSHKSAIFILPLYVIGITCAQMLVEVAPRYHYSIIPFLIMIAQFYLFKKKEN